MHRRSQTRDQNRLLRLCEQVIDQRSCYPLFPPPQGSDAPIDLRYMKQFQFEKTPDVLVLPSILNRFCGVRLMYLILSHLPVSCSQFRVFLQRVQDSICLNPGQLCKGESGGTFSIMTILPLAQDKMNAGASEECAHFVPDRTIVEIKRI